MLQKTADALYELEPVSSGKLLSPGYYIDVIKRRFWYFLIPFALIAPLGVAAVMWLPAIYLAQGRLLIESQRIPTELVRPTVTTAAGERIEVMRQRLLTRDNIMALVDRHKLFEDRRSVLSTTDIIELMIRRTQIVPTEIGRRQGTDRVTLTVAVGFEYENPDTAMRVANEYITLLQNEDLRNRTSRATETTRFLEREVRRLQGELTSVLGQVTEARRQRAEAAATTSQTALQAAVQAAAQQQQALLQQHQVFVDETNAQIATLKAERLTKANRLSFSHPEVQAIQRKIASLEQAIATRPTPPPAPQQPDRSDRDPDASLDPLLKQQLALQERLNEANDKLAQAQMGEALERDQYAERLEVIEQPSRPQRPIRPDRTKWLALVLGLAFAAGGGLVVGTEALDNTIRTRGDLTRLVDSHMIAAIPLVESRRDRLRRKMRLLRILGILVLLAGGALAAGYFFLPPPDILWQEAVTRVTRFLSR